VGRVKWLAIGAVAVVALVVGGTWMYINVLREDPPDRLTLDASPSSSPSSSASPSTADDATADGPGATADDLSGTWSPTGESIVGYRVGEVLFGQRTEGVGRTSAISGEVVIDGTVVRSAEFEVDMASVRSDDSRRDNQFRGRIMDVATHPTATLRLAEPIELGSVPPDGEIVEVAATVELTLRGTTRTLPIDISARRNGGLVELNGTIGIVFDEWGIPNPSTMGVTTDDRGDLEFLLVLARG
jgi:polyisoprenoid-binding protein YceI